MIGRTPSALKFFWTVQRPSAVALGGGGAIVGLGLYMALTSPGDASAIDTAMALALLLQMFLASSGFRRRCLRGHFDPLLAAGPTRWRVAAAHCVVSAAPGLVIWAAVIALACGVRPGTWPTPATPPALLAIAFVSTVAWFVSLPTVQYAAGSIWILALVFLAGTRQLSALRSVLYQTGWSAGIRAARAILMCPLLLLSEAAAIQQTVMGVVLVATAAAGLLGAVYIVRFDGRLAEVE